METPPPYIPSGPRQLPGGGTDKSKVCMSTGKFTAILIWCLLSGVLVSLGLWCLVLGDYYEKAYDVQLELMENMANPRKRHPMPKREPAVQHYVAEREISFEMNAGTGFVRIPAQDVWVRKYGIRKNRAAMPSDSELSVDDGHYRFSADVEELRRACGNGARPLPIKWTLTDLTNNKDKAFHITTLLVQYREDGTADVVIDGYLFDK